MLIKHNVSSNTLPLPQGKAYSVLLQMHWIAIESVFEGGRKTDDLHHAFKDRKSLSSFLSSTRRPWAMKIYAYGIPIGWGHRVKKLFNPRLQRWQQDYINKWEKAYGKAA